MENLVTFNNRYNRSEHDYIKKLENKLKENYGKNAVVVTSGLHAISIILNMFLTKLNFNIIYSKEMYSETYHVFEQYSNCKFYFIEEVELKDISDQNNLIYCESCSNPSGNIVDYKKINEIKKISKLSYTIIDNTWLTECIHNPFYHDVDIVILSLTKYYSGGNAIGGAILGGSKFIKKIKYLNKINGIHVSPVNCDIIYKNYITMNERIRYTSDLTIKIIKEINEKFEVLHPYITNNKNNLFNVLYPSVFSVNITSNKDEIYRIISENNLKIKILTSFGSKTSRLHIYKNKIRFSIGYGDNLDILNDILKILTLIKNNI